jgi:adenosylcobinamide-GDP ribazoletransferase
MPAADALRGAVGLLTRVPAGDVGAADAARGAAVFPLIGAAIGAAAGGLALALHPTLPALLAAAVAVSAELALTGALHLDGLADTADALGAPTRARALEAMRDPRIGTFGAAAVALDVVVRVAVVDALLERGGALVALAAAGALGRAAILPLAAALPYARPGGGLSERIGPGSTAVGVLLAGTVAVGLAGWIGVAMLGTAAVTTCLLGLGYRRRFGGVTGDAMGAAVEGVTLVSLVVAVALH